MEIRFKKIKLQNEELGLQIGEHTLSLKRFFDVVLLAVLLAFAYNIGIHDAQEMIKFTAYMSEKGICDYAKGVCYKCNVMAKDNKVVWDCEKINNTFSQNILGIK